MAQGIDGHRNRTALRLHVCDGDYDFSAATADLRASSPPSGTQPSTGRPGGDPHGVPQPAGEQRRDGRAGDYRHGAGRAGADRRREPHPDTDGLTDVDFTYQWLRVDADGTSNEEDISGEIGETYTLTDADEGKKVKVKVSFTDDLSGEEDRTSAAYPSSGTVTTAASTNTAPTGADKTVTTVQNTNYTFSRTDFGFVDADDDQLASVLIVTVPTAGRLVLNGDTVMASQTVTRTEIVVGSGLKFEPADGASGAGYASFTFKVNDGTDDSVSAYTMTINVTIITAPDAPTGLTATASGQAWIELAWTAPVRAGGRAVTGYRIEVSLDGSSWSDLVLVAATRSTATTYVHKGLNAGATRYYRVSAINVAGASEPSGSDHATTRTDEQLVSNFNHRGDAGNDNVHLVRQNVVGIFTTGSRDARLNSIELRLGHLNRSFVPTTLKLYEAEKGTGFQRVKHGEKEVATLTIPSRRLSLPANSFQTFSYEPPSGTSPPSLTASTKYIFVLEESSVGVILVETTNDLSEDAVKADGWTIDGSGLGTTSPYSIRPTQPIVVRVNGTDTPTPPRPPPTTR